MTESYFSSGDSLISSSTANMLSLSYNLNNLERLIGLPQIEEVNLGNTSKPGTFFAFGLNHKTAPVEIREKLYVDETEIVAFLGLLRETLSECLVLSTCNRTEIYAVSESPEIDIDYYKNLLVNFKNASDDVRDEHFFALISCTACQQLFNVATSIDSKIVGDAQILRQLRAAYSKAQAHGFAGKILNQLLQRAFKLGKQTYTRTSIHDGVVSASLAAVELAIETFGSLKHRTALVIGAGEISRQTAEALVNKQVGRLLLTNRTRANADELISGLNKDFNFAGEAVDFEDFKRLLPEVDIVISSTGSEEPILYSRDFAEQTSETLVIDIAVPRDVDVSVDTCANVVLKNIDDLNSIVDNSLERRLNDVPAVKKMVTEEMADFLTWYYLLPLLPEYEKTGVKPGREQRDEVLRIKEFLSENVAEIHTMYARTSGNFDEDLAGHFELVERLRSMKARAFAAGV